MYDKDFLKLNMSNPVFKLTTLNASLLNSPERN
jgi:hypothetical protein